VTFIAADNAWIQAAAGFAEGEISRSSAFCAWAIYSLEVLWIEDTIADVRFSDNPLVLSDPFIRFYAGAPIVTPEGYALGALCVIDYVPRLQAPGTSKALLDLSRRVSEVLQSN
jgi:GAF domain-containing protein